jgi:uncharacterized oxidoreductase
MKVTGNTVLITGGATGIGFALAEAFLNTGNKVIVCGRKENRLAEAKAKLPQLNIVVCDLSKKEERASFYISITDKFKDINVLVNNAGIQNIVDFKKGTQDLLAGEDEIEINLVAPVYLSAFFIPVFLTKEETAIINISSSLGFVPKANKPVYSATKAAIHSFSLSLRCQLKDTSVKVFEVIPPMVDTGLLKMATGEMSQGFRGIKPAEVASNILAGLANNEYEIAIGKAREVIAGVRVKPEQVF